MYKFLAVLLCSFGFAQNITFEANHFTFNGDEKDITEEVINLCEDHYSQISQNLSKELEKKISINIYPDLATFHKAINKEDASDFYICKHDSNSMIIHLVSPYNPGPLHCSQSVKAAMVAPIESFFLESYYNLPQWLVDSIAAYKRAKILEESQECSGSTKRMTEALQSILKEENFKIANIETKNIFQLFEEELKTYSQKEARDKAFERRALANSFVQYVIDNWGYAYLLQLDEGKCFCKVFGMQTYQLEKKWFEYIKDLNCR